MTLPIDYNTVAVRGKYVYLDGTPAQGTVRFTGKVLATSDATDTIILPATISAPLNANGEFVVNLPATNDPDIQPNGWTYRVEERFNAGGGRTFDIEVPIAAAGTGIDISDIAPVAPAPGDPTAFVTLTAFNEAFEDYKVFFNVLDYGAIAGTSSANASANNAAITAAVNAAKAAGSGTVYFPRGVYTISQPVNIAANIRYLGDVGTTIRATSASEVIKTEDFDTLWSLNQNNGPSRFRLENLSFDGNGVAGYVAKIYGYNYTVENCQFFKGAAGGVWSRWAQGGTNMEAQWCNSKIYNNGGLQFDWQGPHDSQFFNLIIFTDYDFHGGAAIPGSNALRINEPSAGGEQFINLHVWGYHDVGVHVHNSSNGDVKFINCTSEGARTNVWLDDDLCMWDGAIYGTNGIGPYSGQEVGIRIGTDNTVTPWMTVVRGNIWNWAAGDKPIFLAGDNGNDIEVNVRKDNASDVIFYRAGVTSPRNGTKLNIVCPDQPAFSTSTNGFGGNGAPNNTLGRVGSYYFRWDGTAGSNIYKKTAANTWTAIL